MKTDDDTLDPALARALAALPRGIEPTRDLWPGIAAGIAAEAPRPAAGRDTLRWAPIAAAATLLLALSSAIGGFAGYRAAEARFAAQAPVAELDRLELAYANARADYLRELALGNPALPAPTREALRGSFHAIDHAAGELHGALAKEPGNPRYVEALVRTRDSEIDMLARITDSTTTSL